MVRLSDIPADKRTSQYIVDTYGVSKVTAWRLLSGKSDHICPGYRTPTLCIVEGAWEVIASPTVTRHIRKCIAYQLKIWRRENSISAYIDDIAQECYIRAYQKSGIWMDMPENKKMAYLATMAKRTTNDIMAKSVHYTDKYKNDMYLFNTCKAI